MLVATFPGGLLFCAWPFSLLCGGKTWGYCSLTVSREEELGRMRATGWNLLDGKWRVAWDGGIQRGALWTEWDV